MTEFNISGLEPPLRDIRETMDFPMMALEKGRTVPIFVESARGYVKVVSAADSHIASIYDHDIIIYLVSELNDAKNRGAKLNNVVLFHPCRLLKGIGRGTSGRDYQRLADSIRRLRTTTITTNLKITENFGVEVPFSWVQRYEIPTYRPGRDSTKVRASMPWRIELPHWVCSMIDSQRDILRVHPDYFSLKSAIARALYRTARKSVNPAIGRWQYHARTLHQRYAIRSSLSRFIRKVCEIADADLLPDYCIDVVSDGQHTTVVFRKKMTPTPIPIRGAYRPGTDPELIAGGKL
ncbi:replication initiator protein A [Kordiimonas lacus]|uniref:Replication initiator protein A n=1 Tax=Kordiimonas lacus TaxID=637679 RepID=A0A1G6U653_9PROT|nr:Replication initiator protein A [Kordiimonas lacus]